MAAYDAFARFYDAAMGDRGETVDLLRRLIEQYHPRPERLLELACGTGSILKGFEDRYDLYGMDASSEMLRIARAKLPSATFLQADIATFSLPVSFDVILCVFDSINHLTTWGEWVNLFRAVRAQLRAGGLFIFDMNTVHQLEQFTREPPWIHWFDRHSLTLEITDAGENLTDWRLQVFEDIEAEQPTLHEMSVQERAFPLDSVLTEVRRSFAVRKVLDPHRRQPSATSGKLYIVCQANSGPGSNRRVGVDAC